MQSDWQRSHARDWIAVIFALVLPTLVTLAYFVLATDFSPAVQQGTYAVAKTFQFLFPVLYVWRIQRGRVQIKLGGTEGVWQGIIFGFTVAVLMLALYRFVFFQTGLFTHATEAIRAKIAGMNLASPAVYITVGVFYSLIHSLLEEYYWRWFVFGQLERLTRLGFAILLSSLGFMAHHVLVIGTYFGFFSPVTWIFSLCVAIGGGYWAWLYHRSDSLVGPWISHLLVDAAIFTVGYHIAGPLIS
jgi:uncharacterized protein